jgi:2-polyprenyl-3-methyl-5-hydroxy-6-metoxy-1,4-benzoquinol methylase
MKDTVNQFWNEVHSEDFDARTRRSGRIKAINRMAAIAKPYLVQKDAITIDLGCGTGLFAETTNISSIIGVDFSFPLLLLARKRMQSVLQQSIFDLELGKNSVDNVVSLFVIDDYPTERKRIFFKRIFSFLKPDGRFFFAAYSPNDERMSALKEKINKKAGTTFIIYLENLFSYKNMLQECNFVVDTTEIIKTPGVYEIGSQAISLMREFILIVVKKPL